MSSVGLTVSLLINTPPNPKFLLSLAHPMVLILTSAAGIWALASSAALVLYGHWSLSEEGSLKWSDVPTPTRDCPQETVLAGTIFLLCFCMRPA